MKKIICALCIGFLCTLMLHCEFETTEAALAKSVIRLHVLANSDSAADQQLKLKVRDRIIKEAADIFDTADIIAAKEDIEASVSDIRRVAEDEIAKNGYDYKVKISFGMSDFPTKEYGNLILPAGSYEALKVEIGEAKGQNWWCVLFPPLCFVDETCVTASSDSMNQIEESVGKERAELISKEKGAEVELKFKAYEIWQSGKRKIAAWFGKNNS